MNKIIIKEEEYFIVGGGLFTPVKQTKQTHKTLKDGDDLGYGMTYRPNLSPMYEEKFSHVDEKGIEQTKMVCVGMRDVGIFK